MPTLKGMNEQKKQEKHYFILEKHWKHRSKQYDGLFMASAGLSKVLVFKKELLTNHHMVFMKSDGFLLAFH